METVTSEGVGPAEPGREGKVGTDAAESTFSARSLPENSNVVIICASLGRRGSVANVALNQLSQLSKYFSVTMISDSLPTQALSGVAAYKINPWRFNILRRFAHVPNEISFALFTLRALIELHRQCPVSFVLCHSHSIAAIVGNQFQRWYGVGYALVTHGEISDVPVGTYDPRQTWFYKQVAKPAYRRADLVVALSPYMARLAIENGAEVRRVKLCPNGISLTEIGLQDIEIDCRQRTINRLEILFVGRLSLEKGVDVLVAAAGILQLRGVKFRLRIVGNGAKAATLRRQIASLSLNDCVEFVGEIARIDLGRVYRSADVVCVPSRGDPLPTVILEAMASGTAVVGTDTGGIPFMIDHGKTGMVCPVGSPSDLATHLERLYTEEGLAYEMGRAGKRKVLLDFTWERLGGLLASKIAQVCLARTRL